MSTTPVAHLLPTLVGKTLDLGNHIDPEILDFPGFLAQIRSDKRSFLEFATYQVRPPGRRGSHLVGCAG